MMLLLLLLAQDVQGVVVDDVSSLPLAGVSVQLRQGDFTQKPLMATTGGDGRFVIAKAPVGQYRVFASAPSGYLVEESFVRPVLEVKADGSVVPELLRIRMIPEAVLSGRLLTETGVPIANASLQFGRVYGNTSASGEFELKRVEACASDCLVTVRIPTEVQAKSVQRDAKTGRVTGLPDFAKRPVPGVLKGQRLNGAEIRVPNETLVTLSGSITDAAQGTVVKLVSPQDRYVERFVEQDPNGFRFELVPVGSYLLRVSKRMELLDNSREIAVELDRDRLNERFAMPKPLVVTGVLRKDGKPFFEKGITVSLMKRDPQDMKYLRAELHQDGSFEFAGATPGQWMVSVGTMNRELNVRSKSFEPITIAPGQQTVEPLVVDVIELLSMKGRILDEQGVAVRGAVALVNAKNQRQYLFADRFGNFGSSVEPGEYTVAAWRATETTTGAVERPLEGCPNARKIQVTASMVLDVRVCR